MESDIICLTETQLSPAQNIDDITAHLNNFDLIRNDSDDKFQSIAMCYRDTTRILDSFNSPGVSLIKVIKNEFSKNPINILLIYRKQSWSLPSFYDALTDLITTNNIHVILGDFNINAFTDMHLSRLLANFKLIVDSPTHLSGSLLDHVYVSNNYLQEIEVTAIIKNVYFSDHDAIKFRIFAKKT